MLLWHSYEQIPCRCRCRCSFFCSSSCCCWHPSCFHRRSCDCCCFRVQWLGVGGGQEASECGEDTVEAIVLFLGIRAQGQRNFVEMVSSARRRCGVIVIIQLAGRGEKAAGAWSFSCRGRRRRRCHGGSFANQQRQQQTRTDDNDDRRFQSPEF
jgi:hypothetical protein